MTRSDNTMPWRLRQADRPDLPWNRILNTTTLWHRAHNKKRANIRRYWSGERQQARAALAAGDEAPGQQSAFRVRASLW